MPRTNRVTPHSQIVATKHRGAWLGNRGRLHDKTGQVRWFQMSTRWIICELEFRGIRRELMKPGSYTELFFMDEATALAAGHRPCNTCRRASAQQFLQLSGATSLRELDLMLHAERMKTRRVEMDWRTLPNGAMIGWLAEAYMVWDEALYHWSFTGYRRVESIAADLENRKVLEPLKVYGTVYREEDVDLLTPPKTVEILRAGYLPQTGRGVLRTDPS